MKITQVIPHTVQVNQGGSWVFVQIHTDAGLSGIGELNPSAPRKACLVALECLAAQITNKDPRNITALCTTASANTLNRAEIHAISAVEQALWDILGKSLNVPVFTLLGGPCHQSIRLYANISRIIQTGTPEEFCHNAINAAADGFDAIKIAPFNNHRWRHDRAADIANGIRCAEAVRTRLGSTIDLMVDCYGLYNATEASTIAAALEDLNLFWFEEPVHDTDIAGYAQVKKQTQMRLAGAENRMLQQGFCDIIENRSIDIIMPDVTIVGGIGELMKVAALAAKHNIQTAPHGPFGPVAVASGVQCMAAHPEFLILEYAWGQVPWRQDLVVPTEKIHNGHIKLNDQPGLGIELNMATVTVH